ALFNGMGGGAAAAIAAIELLRAQTTIAADPAAGLVIGQVMRIDVAILGILGALIGSVAFTGSLIAWAKLDGRMRRNRVVPAQQLINLALFVATILCGIWVFFTGELLPILLFFALALVLEIGRASCRERVQMSVGGESRARK